MRIRQGFALAFVSVCGVVFADAARPRAAATDYVVHLPVTVTHKGAPVTGLTSDSFSVVEDGQRRTIATLAAAPIPLSLAIIVDTSPQMRGPWMGDTFGAVRDLIATALTPEDEAAIYVFARQAVALQQWAARDVLLDSRYKVPDGAAGAPLFEAITKASRDSDKAKHRRRAIVVITGGSTSDGWRRQPGPAFQEPMGRTTPTSPTLSTTNAWEPSAEREKALQEVKRRKLSLFTIGLESPKASDRKVEPMPPIDAAELRTVSEATGGYLELVASTDAIPRAVRRLKDELQGQYIVSFTSPTGGDGKFHEVTIAVNNPEYQVRARTGYAAIKGQR